MTTNGMPPSSSVAQRARDQLLKLGMDRAATGDEFAALDRAVAAAEIADEAARLAQVLVEHHPGAGRRQHPGLLAAGRGVGMHRHHPTRHVEPDLRSAIAAQYRGPVELAQDLATFDVGCRPGK